MGFPIVHRIVRIVRTTSIWKDLMLLNPWPLLLLLLLVLLLLLLLQYNLSQQLLDVDANLYGLVRHLRVTNSTIDPS